MPIDAAKGTSGPVGAISSPAAKPSLNPASAPTEESLQRDLAQQLNRMSGAEARDASKNQGKGNNKLGKEEFLKLFMEQLKHQDPLQPMQNNEFSQHMALFSQLEQQINMNQNLEKLIGSSQNTHRDALQLIGRHVEGGKIAVHHTKDQVSPVDVKLPQDAREVKIHFINETGGTVRTLTLGERRKGELTEKWDGKDENGKFVESGKYAVKIEAKDMSGQPIQITDGIKGKVTGVTTNNGKVQLLVGDQKVDIEDVGTITEGDAPKQGLNVNGAPGPENVSQKSEEEKTSVEQKSPQVSVAADAERELEGGDGDSQKGVMDPAMPFWYR